jgi:hypothetical protein
MVRGDDSQNPENVRIELFSELDYYFLYEHNCDEEDYMIMR